MADSSECKVNLLMMNYVRAGWTSGKKGNKKTEIREMRPRGEYSQNGVAYSRVVIE